MNDLGCMAPMPILEARKLTKRFAVRGRVDVEVFRDLSFGLAEGELAALIGPSGSGKSTLLHLLGTLDKPTSGEVLIEGSNVAKYGDKELSTFRNHRIGFIFQFHHLLPEFTALENVAMPGMIAGKNFRKKCGHARRNYSRMRDSRSGWSTGPPCSPGARPSVSQWLARS